MKKKIMSVLLSTAMVASMLAGCGSTTNEETSDATVAATKAAAQESTVAEEGGSETTGDGDLAAVPFSCRHFPHRYRYSKTEIIQM